MKPACRIVTPVVKNIIRSFCKVDWTEFKKVPQKGPLIIAVNHINFLEVPILYSFLFPRRVHGIVKAETWENLLLGKLADIWEAIPIDRDSTDMKAMRLSLDVLSRRRILIIAPEGTRSGTGYLSPGHSGIVTLAAQSGAPILPVAHFGGEKVWSNLKSFRSTRFNLKVGRPFYLSVEKNGINKRNRQIIADEIMYRIAELLPPRYRGVYSNTDSASINYLRFLNGDKAV